MKIEYLFYLMFSGILLTISILLSILYFVLNDTWGWLTTMSNFGPVPMLAINLFGFTLIFSWISSVISLSIVFMKLINNDED